MDAALATDDLARRLGELAALPPTREERGPEPLRQRIVADAERWIRVVRETGMAVQ